MKLKRLLKIWVKQLKIDVEDGNTQTPAIKIIRSTQSICDTLALTKRSKIFFQLDEKLNGDVFWNGIFVQPIGENGIMFNNQKYDITPNIQFEHDSF